MDREVRPESARSGRAQFRDTPDRDAGRQLKGDVHLTYEPAGFVYAFEVPLASLTSAAA
jgi:hypothetical protein